MKIQRFLIDAKQPPSFQQQIMNAFPEARVANLGEGSGDLLIQLESKTIVIEVKEVPGDFIASITDRRLFRQSEGIRSITPWSFLLLGDDFKYNSGGQVMGVGSNGFGPLGTWSREHIEGALTAVQARGVIVRVAYRGYVQAIRHIISWVETADEGAVTSEVIKLSPLDRDDQETVNLLSWFDGVGIKQAKSFLAWANKNGKLPRYMILTLATTEFRNDDKPNGWTNNTIRRNRQKMQYPFSELTPKTEWTEELDEAPSD